MRGWLYRFELHQFVASVEAREAAPSLYEHGGDFWQAVDVEALIKGKEKRDKGDYHNKKKH